MPPRSRATRNQDATSRRQGQAFELDPTDGLPVQKYALQTIQVNQDASTDQAATNTKSTNSAEWAAQFNTPQFPWPEPPLPSYFKELNPWNQEMIRRARAGNTNAKLSVWDRKTTEWMSAAEAEKKATPLKSVHLNNLDVSSENNGKLVNGDAESTKSNDDEDTDSSNESNKSADEDEEDESAPFKPSTSSKRRKLASRLNGIDDTRVIELKKWVLLPPNIAEKTPDRSFLAPRRQGMPYLYNPEYAQKVFGQYHSSATISGSAGYDLGEGGGLNNASGVLGSGPGDAAGTATPPRKNIPPRRKKKKLGGPGRKKANPNPETQPAVAPGASTQAGDGSAQVSQPMEGVEATAVGAGEATNDDKAEVDHGADDDENHESGSEAEGSEEGEIDETGGAGNDHDTPQPQAVNLEQEAPPAVPDVPEIVTLDAETKQPDLLPVPSEDQESAKEEPGTEFVDHEEPSTVTESLEATIPGLGEIKDPEEKAIVDENAEALTSAETPEPAVTAEIQAVPEAMHDAVVASSKEEEVPQQVTEETKEKTPEPPAQTEEIDLLGGLDAVIDQGMKEDK